MYNQNWSVFRRVFLGVFFNASEVKDKVGLNPTEAEISRHRKTFETCAIACCDKNIQKLPNLMIKLKAAFESGAL